MAVVRIAVTGGPGAGKSTLWRQVAARHADKVVAVPEVATLMFSHVFPAVQNELERCAVQRAIYRVQQDLELVHESRLDSGQVLLCDRGLPDGGGYWPDGHEAFFEAMQSDWDSELRRYDAVLFMESAAVGGLSISTGNRARCEDETAAALLDRRLRAVWSPHSNFAHVAHELDFAVKLARGEAILERWITRSAT
jgi:hypothetical protein